MIYVIDFEKFTCGARHMLRIFVHKETMCNFSAINDNDAQSQKMLKFRATDILLEHDHLSKTFA